MTLPKQFKKGNETDIFIYHYVEEMVSDFGKHLDETFDERDITKAEFPFLLRIRFKEKTTQKDLVELFKVSEGYTAKILRKFEDKGYITRMEDPTNRRRKIVELTRKGIEKTDELTAIVDEWENSAAKNLTEDELKTLKKLLFKLLQH